MNTATTCPFPARLEPSPSGWRFPRVVAAAAAAVAVAVAAVVERY